jgi:acyl-coenzyme A thioesterase PaaI-like protein
MDREVRRSPPWDGDPVVLPRDELVAALRDVQDLVVERDPPQEDLRTNAELLRHVAANLRRSPTVEWIDGAGEWDALSQKASSLVPPFVVDRSAGEAIEGRVTFSSFYHGGGGAVHGGAIPLLFDQVLGRLDNAPGRTRSRTAYLHVNYRQIAPLGRDLHLDARLDREEGRKLFATARLRDGEDLLADAEGLYIVLRPGQP